jgi:hypothetical protein
MFNIPETFADDMVKHQMVNPSHDILFHSRVVPAVFDFEKPNVVITAECVKRTGRGVPNCPWRREATIQPREWNSG